MPRKAQPAAATDNVALPVHAFNDLQAFRDELFNIATTIDPVADASPIFRKHEHARRRALAKVFRLWGEQVQRSLGAVALD